MGDIAVYNANIITMNERMPAATTAVVRDGRFAVVGAREDIGGHLAGDKAIDLRGKTVVPGFIDSHVHFTSTGLKELLIDLSAVRSKDEIKARVAKAAETTPPGNVILGLRMEFSRENDYLTVDELDRIAPRNPVFLLGVTGHFSLANTRCIERIKIPEGTPHIDPTGLIRGQANTYAGRKARALAAQEIGLRNIHRAAAARAVAVGLTTIHALEGNDQKDDPMVASLLDIQPELPLHLVIWYQTTDVAAVKRLGLPRIGGCILLDGDFDPHTAALSEPYEDDPAETGTLYYSQDFVNDFVERAHRAGLQIAMHAVGDRAARQALDAYERALQKWPRDDHRHRIEHFEIYDRALVARARELGVYLAIQPPFNGHAGGHNSYVHLLGRERSMRLDPVASLIQDGLRVGGGSDSTVTPLKPLHGVHCAVNHSNPRERISVHRALQLYTMDNAYLAFEENERGSIEKGKAGDFVVLSEDPLAAARESIGDIQVEMTVFGGEIVYRAP